VVQLNHRKEREVPKMFFKEEVETCASALYDGGWRSSDEDEMKKEYDLDDEWAEAICKKLKEYEKEDGEND
jgi:hypothetical protein